MTPQETEPINQPIEIPTSEVELVPNLVERFKKIQDEVDALTELDAETESEKKNEIYRRLYHDKLTAEDVLTTGLYLLAAHQLKRGNYYEKEGREELIDFFTGLVADVNGYYAQQQLINAGGTLRQGSELRK